VAWARFPRFPPRQPAPMPKYQVRVERSPAHPGFIFWCYRFLNRDNPPLSSLTESYTVAPIARAAGLLRQHERSLITSPALPGLFLCWVGNPLPKVCHLNAGKGRRPKSPSRAILKGSQRTVWRRTRSTAPKSADDSYPDAKRSGGGCQPRMLSPPTLVFGFPTSAKDLPRKCLFARAQLPRIPIASLVHRST